MSATRYRFTAVKRDGSFVGGVFSTDRLAEWVKDRYRWRWRRLDVVQDDAGTEVARILKNPDTGRRTWWAES